MISIVTGTLDRKDLLDDLIKDTVDRSDKLELILVDGGSTDGTQEYIKNLAHPKVTLIEVGHRSSYGHYMNIGVRAAKYDYICQWNDDVLLDNTWDEIIELLNSDEDAYIFNWYVDGYEHQKYIYFLGDNEGIYTKCMSFGIYKKKIFKEIGLYDEITYEYYACDSDMTERAFKFGYKLKACPQIMVKSLDVEKKATGNMCPYDKLFPNIQNYYNHKSIPEWITFLK